MRTHSIPFLFLLIIGLISCEKTIPTEGFIDVKGGKVWYKIYGAEKKKTPVLLLHGGPGFPSDYLRPLQELASERPVIFYDQLGCGRSDLPADTTLWELVRFVSELSTIRDELGLDSIHLFGHSAGTMLAAEYLASKPKGIKSIIFAGPIFSSKKHLESVNQLKLKLPTPIRDTLLLHEKIGTIYSPAYQDAYLEFVKLYWCRTFPFPEAIQKSMNYATSEVFKTMWGDYEFYCPGNLKDFDREYILTDINVPTLFTCGQFDLTTPESTARYAKQVKGAEFVIFEDIAHMTMNEDPKNYVKVIREFLSRNE